MTANQDAIGYYVNPDDALCDVCAPDGFVSGDYSQWSGCHGWETPSVIRDDSASDSPTHCGECGELIRHDLTPDGYDYVSEALGRALDGHPGNAIGAWMDAYGDQVDIPATYLDPFINGYAHTMLWANLSDVRDVEGTGHDARPEDWQTPADGWQLRAFTSWSQTEITRECTDFVRETWCDLAQLPPSYGRRNDGTPDPRERAASAGHDFALTRNRHGAGFWGRGLGDLGERLTVAAHSYGESAAEFDGAEFDEGRAVVWLDGAPDAPIVE